MEDKKQKNKRDKKPVKVLKKVKTSDGQTKLLRPGAPGFETRIQETLPASQDQRIAKHLARVGVASRREVERMIADGRVSLNGQILKTPAVLVGPRDKILVDGQPIGPKERTRLWLYHKPKGLVTTNNDPEGRTTVFEKLPEDLPRVLSVGRLDIATEGLLLLTNDGGLARQLELPSTGWLRRYRVRVHGKVDEIQLKSLADGIAVDGVLYGSIDAELDRQQGSNSWLTLSFREGKNREVRNVLGALGLEVNRLIRVSYGPFQLGELDEGECREIRGRTLRDQLGEKLVAASGADFDSEILHHAKPNQAKSDTGSRGARGKTDFKRKGQSEDARPRKKANFKRGQMSQENVDRLDTKPNDKKFDKSRGSKRPDGSKGAGKFERSSDRSSSHKRGDSRNGNGNGGSKRPFRGRDK